MAKKSEPDWTLPVLGASALFLFLRLRKEAEKAAPKTSLGFDDNMQWAYDKAHGGTRWGPRSMGGGYDTFGGAAKDSVRQDLQGRVGPARQLYADPGSIQYEGPISRRGRRDGSTTAKYTVRFKLKGTPYKRVALEDSDYGGIWIRVNNVKYRLEEFNPAARRSEYDAWGVRYTPRIDGLGASRPSRYVPSARNALWWGRRGMNPPWEEGFGQDVVPHLCETQWAESDARCIQHLGDPTFGSSLLREETAELSQYFSAFGSKSRG